MVVKYEMVEMVLRKGRWLTYCLIHIKRTDIYKRSANINKKENKQSIVIIKKKQQQAVKHFNDMVVLSCVL